MQRMTDAQVRDEQDVYDKHAIASTDPQKVPYMQVLQDMEEAVADVETEILMIENGIAAVSSLNSSSIVASGATSQVVVVNAPASESKKKLYSGSATEFKAFLAEHNATVGSKPSIPNVTKLSLLKEKLDGEAYDCVKRYSTNEDYDEAIKKLTARFGVEADAVAELRQKLNGYVRNKEDLKEVRKAFDEFEYLLTTLGSYGENIESSEFATALKKKLPAKVLIRIADFERTMPSGKSFDVTELRKAVDTILLDFERIAKFTGANNRYSKFRKGRKSVSPKTVASNAKKEKKNDKPKPAQRSEGASQKPKAAMECAFCEGPHYTDDCPVDKSIEEAKECASEKHLCFKCFRPNHSSRKCRIKVKCRKCGGTHHTVYCKSESNSKREKKDEAPVVASNHAFKNFEDTDVLLLSHEVMVSNPQNPARRQMVLAFIDPGSQVDLIDKELSQALNLPMCNKVVDCQGANGQIFTAQGSYSLNIHLQDGSLYPVKALGSNEMLTKLAVPGADIAKMLQNIRQLSDPLPITYGNPKLLLSMKAFKELVLNQRTVELNNGFSMIYSKIGKLICGDGAVQRHYNRPTSPVVATFTLKKDLNDVKNEDDATFRHAKNNVPETLVFNNDVKQPSNEKFDAPVVKNDEETVDAWVDEDVSEHPDKPVVAQINEYDYTKDPKFMWELELMGIYDNPNADERRLFLQRFLEKVFQDENGRIVTALPFEDESGLGNNYNNCYRRCVALSKHFLKDPIYAHLYKGCVDEFYGKDFTEEKDLSVINEPGTHFMPHCVVITPGKTTKARLVFDGSCITERGVSLNQKLLVGDNRLPSLVGILLRARIAPIVVCSDIEKAFLQIFLIEESRKFVRFMFPKDVTKPFSVDNMVIYQFKVVAFGLGCSSNLLAHAIEYHLKKYADAHPDFAKLLLAVLYSMYVDDLALASKTPEEAIEQNECVKAAFAAGNMNLRGHISTHPDVNKYYNETSESFNFLGHELIIAADSFVVGWKNLDVQKVPKTKRALLSFCASLFDLMGALEPVRLPIKLLIRQAWSLKLDWNSIMDAKMIEDITRLYQERANFSILMPRKIFQNADPSAAELHIFGDASGCAYGCVAFLRYYDENEEIQTHFLFAKSRLAPLKPVMTITKLELTATALCSHVAKFLTEELEKVISINRTVIWTDSTTVLYWIQNPEGKGRYVTNRVHKLRNSGAEFKHVTGLLNPADVVSRGCSPAEFEENELWFKGPAFLRGEEKLWPAQPCLEVRNDVEEAFIVAVNALKSSNHIVIALQEPLINAERVGSWKKLCGITVKVINFLIKKSPKLCFKIFGKNDPDSVDIFKKAEEILIKQIQQAVQVNRNRAEELGLYRSNGIWKKYCRIKANGDPIYLCDCTETRLLIFDMHEKLNHGSVSMILAELNQSYYLPKARTVVKSVIRSSCMPCRKNKAVPYALPLMNDMPKTRSFGRPFESVGVDLAGPVKVKLGDDVVQHWVVLFTCFSSRAIHLELVPSLSGEAFIEALTRFASRRTMPAFIYSDNATNFKVTAATVIPKWICLQDPDVLNYCTSKKIKWKFNTEKAPWAGGIYETMIKLLKRNLKAAVGRRQISFWKMLTLAAQIEAWVNCRPLTYISEDTNQIILRPVDFITPFVKPGVPEVAVDVADPAYNNGDAHENLIELWSQGQQRFTIFKEKFTSDYLKALRERTRHHQQSGHVVPRDPRVGEIVTICDDDDKIFWKLGVIVELISSSDNRIRAAKVKTPSGKILQRPINHLYPLEVDDYSMKHLSQPVKASNVPKLQLNNSTAFYHEDKSEEQAQVESDDHADAILSKVHPMKTRQDNQKKAAGSLLFWNPLLLLICCLICCFGTASAKQCPAGAVVERIYHPSCVQKGYVVNRYENGYCWMKKLCSLGLLMSEKLNPNATICEPDACSCPTWAQECSKLSATINPINPGNSTS
uniref:Integrase catalytic domain-containing protein n=1 Tax=Panagrolaimus sp. ES5 TaxID=591445 RepID=A0AC34FJI4_9BILA